MTAQPCPAECTVVEASGILLQANRYRCVLETHDHDAHEWRRKIEVRR